MTSTTTEWSKEEKQIAQKVLEQTYQKEIALIINHVRQEVANLTQIEELWQIHDFFECQTL